MKPTRNSDLFFRLVLSKLWCCLFGQIRPGNPGGTPGGNEASGCWRYNQRQTSNRALGRGAEQVFGSRSSPPPPHDRHTNAFMVSCQFSVLEFFFFYLELVNESRERSILPQFPLRWFKISHGQLNSSWTGSQAPAPVHSSSHANQSWSRVLWDQGKAASRTQQDEGKHICNTRKFSI